MAEPARRHAEEPPLDPTAIDRAYRRNRARRSARGRRSRQSRRATLRFWFFLLALLAASIGFFLVILREVERLFGL